MLKIIGVDRGRFAPAKAGENDQDGAEDVDMRKGVQRQTAGKLRGIVPAFVGGDGVGPLMDGQCHKHQKQIGNNDRDYGQTAPGTERIDQHKK